MIIYRKRMLLKILSNNIYVLKYIVQTSKINESDFKYN